MLNFEGDEMFPDKNLQFLKWKDQVCCKQYDSERRKNLVIFHKKKWGGAKFLLSEKLRFRVRKELQSY